VSNRQVNGEASRQVHRGLLKTIQPSRDAAELAALLGRHFNWAELQAACRPSRHYSADINREVKEALKGHKGLFGPKREAKRIELRQAAIAERRHTRELLRIKAWDLHELSKLYERHRDRIQALPEEQRPEAAKELVAAYCNPNSAALLKLEGLTEAQIATRRAAIKVKRRNQFIAMELDHAGLKYMRKPMTRMYFPKSAANPLRAIQDFAKDIGVLWQKAVRANPELARMGPKEAAKIVLAGTKFVRMDDEMWSSRWAPFIKSQDEFDKEDNNWKDRHEDNEK